MSSDKYENLPHLIEVFQRFAKADWRKKTMWGLKASEIRAIVCIKQGSEKSPPAMTVSDISKSLSVTSPTVTQIINSLIANGYVNRSSDQKDRRITEVTLTEEGEEVAQKAVERSRHLFAGLIDQLGKEQSDQLILLLDQVYHYLEKSKNKEEQ